MVGRLVSFLGNPISGAMLVLGQVFLGEKKVSPDHMLPGRAVFDACIGLTGRFCWSVYGCFQKKGYPNIPKWMVYFMENPIKMDDLGGKPTIFEKSPYSNGAIFLVFWTPTTTNSHILNLIQLLVVTSHPSQIALSQARNIDLWGFHFIHK